MKLGPETNTPACLCLNCGKLIDVASAVDCDAAPSPGDFTICLACGHLMAFDDELILRELTDAETVDVAGDPRIIAVQVVRQKMEDDE